MFIIGVFSPIDEAGCGQFYVIIYKSVDKDSVEWLAKIRIRVLMPI